MMKKLVSLLALFVATAAVPLVAFTPATAQSAVRARSSQDCTLVHGSGLTFNLLCALTTGSDFPTTALVGVYFDFTSDSSTTSTFNVVKRSYSGSFYQDSVSGVYSSSFTDVLVTVNNVKTNASQWDYVEADALGVQGLLGVSMKNNN